MMPLGLFMVGVAVLAWLLRDYTHVPSWWARRREAKRRASALAKYEAAQRRWAIMPPAPTLTEQQRAWLVQHEKARITALDRLRP